MARKRSRSRSPSPSEYIFTGDRHSIQSHPRQDFGRQNKRQARRPAQPTEAMDALRTAAGHDTAPATTLLTTSANLVYRIRYGVLPYNNSLGHAEVGEGPTTGYTNDADLAMLAAGFSSNYRLQGIRWEVQEVRVGATGVRTLMRMDNGPVELKNGTWATFHGTTLSWVLAISSGSEREWKMSDLQSMSGRTGRTTAHRMIWMWRLSQRIRNRMFGSHIDRKIGKKSSRRLQHNNMQEMESKSKRAIRVTPCQGTADLMVRLAANFGL
ncbi:hypothetical protein PMIN06_000875 [Paraphaeosphaeria minitans]